MEGHTEVFRGYGHHMHGRFGNRRIHVHACPSDRCARMIKGTHDGHASWLNRCASMCHCMVNMHA
jgi:hypothetical protein